MKRLTISLIICGVLLSPSRLQGNAGGADLRRAVSRPFHSDNSYCIYNRLAAGPNGREVAIWFEDRSLLGERQMLPPTRVIVGRIHPPSKSDANELFVLGGAGLRLFPIRWSLDGTRLYLRVREPQERVIAIDVMGRQLLERPLGPEWRATDIGAIKHGDLALLYEGSVTKRIGRIDGQEFIRGSLTLGSTAAVVAARKSDLGLVRLGQRDSDLRVNSGHTRLLTAFPGKTVYAGGISYLGAARLTRGDKYLPYQTPLFDLATGHLAGRFSPTVIEIDTNNELRGRIDTLNERLGAAGAIVLDLSLSGPTLMALLAYPDGNRSIVRVGDDGETEKRICKTQPVAQTLAIRAFQIDQSGRKTANANGAPIVILYGTNDRTPVLRDAVVTFHGGPGGTLADDTYWMPPSLKLLRPDRDIIAIEYAGSVGGGAALTKRLAKDGMNALQEDMDALAAWLVKQRYRRVFIIAGSFGSVPALIFQCRYRRLTAATFHMGPLLKLQKPAVWASTGDGLQATLAKTQLAYELASFGGGRKRERFAHELYFLIANAALTKKDHLYFGGMDDISKPEHLPITAKPAIMIFPLTGHAALGARPEIWRDIERHMIVPEDYREPIERVSPHESTPLRPLN